MVVEQLVARGLEDPAVLGAMRAVPREAFVEEEYREQAYRDTPLPIGFGQTISQPYIVALMVEALELGPSDKVLEVGTGCGYAAAVMAEIAAEVFTIERHRGLADRAGETLEGLGYVGCQVRCGDGTLGWPEQAPFDAIVSAAAGPRVPETLKQQMAPGARLVMPVGEDAMHQNLVRLRRVEDGEFERESLGTVRFVPLIGQEGFEPTPGA